MGGRPRPGLVERHRQNLPVPLGGMAPVRVARRSHRRWLRGRLDALLTIAGVTAAVSGAVLLLLPSEERAALVGGRVEVGSMVLTRAGTVDATGAVVYGGAASYALVQRGDGTAHAAAAWVSSGRLSQGTCDLRRDSGGLLESCTFTVGAATLSALDVLDRAAGNSWQRTYSDGGRVAIAVPSGGAPIPVPFPVGR